MKPKRYTDEQIVFALRQAEGGTAMEEICRKLGISESGTGSSRRLRAAPFPALVMPPWWRVPPLECSDGTRPR